MKPIAWVGSDGESFSFTEPPSKNYLGLAWWKPVYLGCTSDKFKAAITGLLKYHQEGDDGAELPREYWSPGYREAVEIAEALVGSNAGGKRHE